MEDAQLGRVNAFRARTLSPSFDPGDYELCYDGIEDARLKPYSFVVENPGKLPNKVFVRRQPKAAAPADLVIRFMASGGEVYVDGSTQIRGLVRHHADGCVTVIGGHNKQHSRFIITHWSKRTLVHLGQGVTSNGVNLVAMGEGAAILVGDDCMFSTGVWVKSSDMHAIVDLATDKMVNRNGNVGDIEIGRHVWIGQDVLITQGVKVGSGAALGAKSLVRHDVPAQTLWAGVPARQLRENVTWMRSHTVMREELAQVRTSLGLSPKAGARGR
jgi:acetyltransferase-like isoleucine patch superfamily enzyme